MRRTLLHDFIDWNKKVIRENKPIFGVSMQSDGQGNKDYKFLFPGGSKVQYQEHAAVEEKKEQKFIEVDEIKLLD